MGVTTTGPHRFRPLRPWDALLPQGRCKHCYAPRFAHPMHCWVKARPYGDRSEAVLDFAHLHPVSDVPPDPSPESTVPVPRRQ